MKLLHLPNDFSVPTPTPSPDGVPPPEIVARSNVRIFLDIEGVVMNFTLPAASALDDLEIPVSSSGTIEPNPVYHFTSDEILYDICHGFEFYAEACPVYPWTDVLFEEVFKMSMGNVYFLGKQNKWDRGAWGGKAQWIWEKFGDYGYTHLLMVSEKHMLPFQEILRPHHILIDNDMENIRAWCQAGGTGYWWPELDPRADLQVTSMELGRRLRELRRYVDTLVDRLLYGEM